MQTVLAVLALVAAVPLLWVAVGELVDHRDVRQVPLQLDGSREAGCPVPADAVRRYRSAVAADGWLVAGYVLAGLGVLVGAGFLIAQTWLSLHPFYRTRLASSFAVRRARMPDDGGRCHGTTWAGPVSAGSRPAPWRRPASRPCGGT